MMADLTFGAILDRLHAINQTLDALTSDYNISAFRYFEAPQTRRLPYIFPYYNQAEHEYGSDESVTTTADFVLTLYTTAVTSDLMMRSMYQVEEALHPLVLRTYQTRPRLELQNDAGLYLPLDGVLDAQLLDDARTIDTDSMIASIDYTIRVTYENTRRHVGESND